MMKKKKGEVVLYRNQHRIGGIGFLEVGFVVGFFFGRN